MEANPINATTARTPLATEKYDRAMLGRKLIRMIVEHTPPTDKGFRPYYMFNSAHPVINDLLERYREANGISPLYPMSDEDRMDFELQLVNGSLIREIERYCDGT